MIVHTALVMLVINKGLCLFSLKNPHVISKGDNSMQELSERGTQATNQKSWLPHPITFLRNLHKTFMQSVFL